MHRIESFLTDEDKELSSSFLKDGYVIRDVCNFQALVDLQKSIAELACTHLGQPTPNNPTLFLNSISKHVSPETLNALRLFIFRSMNDWKWLRPTYYAIGGNMLNSLVGNELAMQNKVNLSIQMPNDNSSLLDIHSDVYGGETPFQVVQWLPLVDVAKTQSMFILPKAKTQAVESSYHKLGDGGMAALFDMVKDDLIWLNIPFGKVLIFDSSCLHGNVLNEESTTRWSMNCRFTSVFTPYISAEKKLGSFYLPITLRAVSRVGMKYKQPEGFSE